MTVHMLLVVESPTARQRYEAEIAETECRIDVVSDIDAFLNAVTRQAYHGLLIDLRSKIKLFRQYQDLIASVCKRYPVILLSIDPDEDKVRALLFGHHEATGELGGLIDQHCRNRQAKTFRAHKRRKINFHALISTGERFSEADAVRTVSLDVSTGGCFLYFVGPSLMGRQIWIKFIGLDDADLIQAEVRRQVFWGTDGRMPGIGVSFTQITEDQIQALGEPF